MKPFRRVVLTFTIRNDGASRVRAWRLGVALHDPFGTEVYSGLFNDGSANILPGREAHADYSFEDNPFISGEPFDRLAGYSSENLKAAIASCEVAVDTNPPRASGGAESTREAAPKSRRRRADTDAEAPDYDPVEAMHNADRVYIDAHRAKRDALLFPKEGQPPPGGVSK